MGNEIRIPQPANREDRKVMTVTQVNNCIKTIIEGADFLANVYIKGRNFQFH